MNLPRFTGLHRGRKRLADERELQAEIGTERIKQIRKKFVCLDKSTNHAARMYPRSPVRFVLQDAAWEALMRGRRFHRPSPAEVRQARRDRGQVGWTVAVRKSSEISLQPTFFVPMNNPVVVAPELKGLCLSGRCAVVYEQKNVKRT